MPHNSFDGRLFVNFYGLQSAKNCDISLQKNITLNRFKTADDFSPSNLSL